MKKILALVLATLMLLSFTAFAEDNMTNTVSEGRNFLQADSASDFGGADSATQRTDVWLQVEASGQIDVTVPLVAIFKTNIDGGKDTIADEYKIINNSSAAIKVTEVVVVDQKTDVSANGQQTQMVMVAELPEKTSTIYDQYTLTMLPSDRYATQEWATAKNVFTAFTAEDTANDTKTFTLTKDNVEGKGLWRVEKKGAIDSFNNKLDESYIDLTLETSKLSFVTKQASKNDENIENGIKLFTVTYTVKIDDSEAVGGDITGSMDGSVYEDRTKDEDIVTTYTYKNTTIDH